MFRLQASTDPDGWDMNGAQCVSDCNTAQTCRSLYYWLWFTIQPFHYSKWGWRVEVNVILHYKAAALYAL